MTHTRGNFFRTHFRTIVALLFGLTFSVFVAYATPPGSAYTPGETLDPTCAPGDTNCSVDINSALDLQTITDNGATTTNAMTVLKTATGSTVTDALLLQNTTAAGFSAPQYSPAIHLQGQGYYVGGAVSQPVDFRVFTFTGNGTGATASGDFRIQSQINSGGYVTRFSINAVDGSISTNGGAVNATGGTITGGLFTVNSGISIANASSPITLNSSVGSSGQVLTSAGAGATPTWTTISQSLSALTAATGSNTINNASFGQEWQWNDIASSTGFKISSSSTFAVSNLQKLFEVTLSGANVFSGQTTYASSFSNTHTGTSSINYAGLFTASGGTINYGGSFGASGGTTNYGGVFSASGGTTNYAAYFNASGGTNNYAAVFASGNVGIATTAPLELLSLGTSGGTRGVFSLAGDTSGKIIIQPAAAAGTWTLTLPTSGGTNGYFLKTDGSGVASWAAAGSGLIGSTSSIGTETWLGTSVAGLGTTSSTQTVFIGIESGYNASSSDQSNFIGYQAGYNAASSYQSSFMGYQAGNGATAYQSNFIGYQAGLNVSGTNNAIFIGTSAGSGASNSVGSTFIGSSAGASAQANNSNFIGQSAGSSTTSADGSVFIGTGTGSGALAAANSVFLGEAAGMNAPTAANSIFIGTYAGGGVFSGDAVDNTGNADDFSILIGNNTTTGGFSNSIALGSYATNTAVNQLMIGSTTRPIEEVVVTGGAQTCTIRPDTAGINCTSDENLKTNITDLESTLEELRNVRTIMYNWKNNPDTNAQIGFIAQDLRQHFPTLVSTASDGYLQVNYAGMTPILVRAVQELDLRITALEINQSNNAAAFFTDVLDRVEGGIAYLRDVVVGTIKVGSPDRRTGVTLYDEVTGEPYCLSIADGATKTVPGECGIIEPVVPDEIVDENPPQDTPPEELEGEDTSPEITPLSDETPPPVPDAETVPLEPPITT